MVNDRPEATWRMVLEICHGHLAAENERNGPCEQPKQYQHSAEQLKIAGKPSYGKRLCDVAAEEAQDLLQSMLGKSESSNYPKQG